MGGDETNSKDRQLIKAADVVVAAVAVAVVIVAAAVLIDGHHEWTSRAE